MAVKKKTPLQLWRESEAKKAKKAIKDKTIDGYNFERKYSIDNSFEKIIIGFDPSTVKAGVSMYEPRLDKVLELESLDPDLLKPWVQDMIKKYPKDVSRFLFRIEMPTRTTSYGVAKAVREKMQKEKKPYPTIEKKVHSIIFSSGMCHDRARQFLRILEGLCLDFELIATQERMNCESNRHIVDKKKDLLYNYYRSISIQRGTFWHFPTKMDIETATYFWPEIVDFKPDKENLDALCCSFPEKLYRKMT